MRLRSVVVVLAVAVALGAGLTGCVDEDDLAEAAPSSSLIPPASTEAPTESSTASTAPATPTTSAPTGYTAQAREAVEELKAAWEAGDQARARAIAPGQVVDVLFAVPAGGFEIYGCDTGEFDTSTCNYRNRSTEVFVVVTAQRSDQGWQIATIDVSD